MLRRLAIAAVVLLACGAPASAQFWCGVWNSPQCRFMKVCLRDAKSQGNCACIWSSVSAIVPGDQHALLADILETVPGKNATPADKTAAQRKQMELAGKGNVLQMGQLRLMMADALMTAGQRCKGTN